MEEKLLSTAVLRHSQPQPAEGWKQAVLWALLSALLLLFSSLNVCC